MCTGIGAAIATGVAGAATSAVIGGVFGGGGSGGYGGGGSSLGALMAAPLAGTQGTATDNKDPLANNKQQATAAPMADQKPFKPEDFNNNWKYAMAQWSGYGQEEKAA